jgi:hypothetical protein
MEQTIMDEVKVARIFVAIFNAGKLETLRLFSLIFQYFSLINEKI